MHPAVAVTGQRVVTNCQEVLALPQVIAPALNQLSVRMADALSIGSYPVSAQHDGAGIVISLEGMPSARLYHHANRPVVLLPGTGLLEPWTTPLCDKLGQGHHTYGTVSDARALLSCL